MLFELLSFLFWLAKLVSAYLIPIALALDSYQNKDKQKIGRWLLHFYFLALFEIFLGPIFEFIGLGFIHHILVAALIQLPLLTLLGLLENQYVIIQDLSIQNSIVEPKIELLRGITEQGLKKLNLY
ncbi:hypothetical protein pb186bvf_013010 [Paramecium bursaria]